MLFTKIPYRVNYGLYTALSCCVCGSRTDRYGRCSNIECDE